MKRLPELKFDNEKANDDNAKANDEITQLRKESSEADEVIKKLTNVIENYLQN